MRIPDDASLILGHALGYLILSCFLELQDWFGVSAPIIVVFDVFDIRDDWQQKERHMGHYRLPLGIISQLIASR